MKIVFRVDASIQIGAGHVMRCLSLADRLKKKGYQCIFLSRPHTGHLNDLIASKGYGIQPIEFDESDSGSKHKLVWNAHAHWLGATWHSDAEKTNLVLGKELPDWLIVDHYALDSCWEKKVTPYVGKIMVIDDLADRKHECDFLLDQTFGRESSDYSGLVPTSCKVLTGAHYSLLRDEFTKWREKSLRRRENGVLRNILISMGAMDKDNYTSNVMKALRSCNLPDDVVITVVMGSNAPWISDVMKIAADMPWNTKVKLDVKSMAKLMCDADLAIGAAGSTSWERCALGLPSIQIVIAKNQRFIAHSLAEVGAVKALEDLYQLPTLIKTAPDWMSLVSQNCRLITDGKGMDKVVSKLEKL